MARTVTLAEMRALSFGVAARTGNKHATFRVIWEDVSFDNPFRQCPVSFDDGRTPTESVAAVLNCTTRRSKAQASFDMFNEIKLNPPWVVDTATVDGVSGHHPYVNHDPGFARRRGQHDYHTRPA